MMLAHIKGLYLQIDRPVTDFEEDNLNFEPLVDALHAVFLEKALTSTSSFTVGILSGWGTGKSSLMKLLRRRLELYPDRFTPVEFNAWRFRREGRLLAPLILTLATAVPEDEDTLKRAIHIAEYTVLGAVNIAIAKYTGGMLTLNEIKRVERTLSGRLERDELLKYRDDIERLVQTITDAGNRTLVVFIDDLERCHPPEMAVELLEDIKLLLDLPNVIYVLGVDLEAIERAISKLYGSGKNNGRNYLEKFIQLPIYLPPHQTGRVHDLLLHETQVVQPPPRTLDVKVSESNHLKLFFKLQELFQWLVRRIRDIITRLCGGYWRFERAERILKNLEQAADYFEDRTMGITALELRNLRFWAHRLRQSLRGRRKKSAPEIKKNINELLKELKKLDPWLKSKGVESHQLEELQKYLEKFEQNPEFWQARTGDEKSQVDNRIRKMRERVLKYMDEKIRGRGEIHRSVDRAIRALRNNPRKAKRFWNLLQFELLVFAAKGRIENVLPLPLVKWLIWVVMYPESYKLERITDFWEVQELALKSESLNDFSGVIDLIFQRWGVEGEPGEIGQLASFFWSLKGPNFGSLEELMNYVFPHEEKFDFLPQLIERMIMEKEVMGLPFSFEGKLDLSYRFLRDGTFKEWSFKGGVDFTGSDLENADFTGADFRPEVSFKQANLKNAKLIEASFSEVDLTDVDVEGANFTDIVVTSGRGIGLHRAKNWDKITVDTREEWERLAYTHEEYMNGLPDGDEKYRVRKFVDFCRNKSTELSERQE